MLLAHGVTNIGRVRKINEDALLCETELGLFVVADGMGGHNAGEVASSLAIEAVRTFIVRSRDDDGFTWPFGVDPKQSYNANLLTTSIKLANRQVFKVSESRNEYTGMGTTLVAALVENNVLTYASVGDSRIYAFHDNALEQITRDDSWVAMIRDRDPAFDQSLLAQHPMRHVLTNVVGAREHSEPVVAQRILKDGEKVLLCTDGLHGGIDDQAIRGLLASDSSVAATAQRLVDAALKGNGTDNITALLIQYKA